MLCPRMILVLSPSKVTIRSSNPFLSGIGFPSGVLFPVVFHSTSIAKMSFVMNLFLIDIMVKVASFRTELNGHSCSFSICSFPWTCFLIHQSIHHHRRTILQTLTSCLFQAIANFSMSLFIFDISSLNVRYM